MTAKRQRDGVIGVIDVGTSKTCCVIWRQEAGTLRSIGFGTRRSRGITAGLVTDRGQAELTVRAAVGQAERMAGVLLDSTLVGIGAGRLSSLRLTARVPLASGVVERGDRDKITTAAHAYAGRAGREVVHLAVESVAVDGRPVTGTCIGLGGTELTADIHATSVDGAALQSLRALIEQCYLTPRFCPSALASGLAVTTPEEREDGVTVVDIGAGMVTLVAFGDGRHLATGQIPYAGDHITYDLQRQLQTSRFDAERIKTLYGSLVAAPSNELERVSVPIEFDGEQQTVSVSRAEVRSAIMPRVDAILGTVGDWRRSNGVGGGAGTSVVLTGGSSQLAGLVSYASDRLGTAVRLGVPTVDTGAPRNLRLASHAAVLGLPMAAAACDGDSAGREASSLFGAGYLGRVGSWLGQNF